MPIGTHSTRTELLHTHLPYPTVPVFAVILLVYLLHVFVILFASLPYNSATEIRGTGMRLSFATGVASAAITTFAFA